MTARPFLLPFLVQPHCTVQSTLRHTSRMRLNNLTTAYFLLDKT